MGCSGCGRSRLSKAISRRTAETAARMVPAAQAAPMTARTPSGLCLRLLEAGGSLVLGKVNGVLVVKHEGVNFEFFSAMRSQGCSDSELFRVIEGHWTRLRGMQRAAVLGRLGAEFPADALIAELAKQA